MCENSSTDVVLLIYKTFGVSEAILLLCLSSLMALNFRSLCEFWDESGAIVRKPSGVLLREVRCVWEEGNCGILTSVQIYRHRVVLPGQCEIQVWQFFFFLQLFIRSGDPTMLPYTGSFFGLRWLVCSLLLTYLKPRWTLLVQLAIFIFRWVFHRSHQLHVKTVF